MLSAHGDQLRSADELSQRLQLALSAANLGDWSWDAATDVVTLSPRASEIFGLAAGRTVTWSRMRELLHPDDREVARVAVERAVEQRSDYSIQYRVLAAAGEEPRWVAANGRATYDEAGRPVSMIGIVQDVTAWRRAEESARSEAQVLAILNRTGAALAAHLDVESVLQQTTDAATQLTGARFGAFFYNGVDEQGEAYLLYTLSGAPRAAFERFGHPRPTPLFAPTFNGGRPIRIDDVSTDARYGKWGPHHGMPPGHLPVRSYLAVPVVGRDQEVIGGLFFGHPDPGVFTERGERLAVGVAAHAAVAIDNARLFAQARSAAEERRQLLESERAARGEAERANALKDEFLATLSHELRTPLSAIMGWVYILRRKLATADPELRKGLEVIERSTRVQTQLIDDLLDMSRITAGKLRLQLEPVQPAAFVEAAVEALRPAAETAGVQLQVRLDTGADAVMGDPARLQQVVWNLLSNALKFTPAGGTVSVRLESLADTVRITVSDTGAGIAREFVHQVFDRFRQADGSITRRYGGLGLGLTIVKYLTELHGGTVSASSPGLGQGATFQVELPKPGLQPRPDPGAGRGDGAALLPDLQGLDVLVVDDEPDARELLQRLLEECGARVTVADGAVAALDAARRQPPRVLVSDIGMPGVDGYELLRRLRALGGAAAAAPAVALTAFARPDDRERALRAGFAAHLGKPVDAPQLLATVAKLAAGEPRPS